MNPEERRITYAACLIVGLTLMAAAGLPFLVDPMAFDLGLSDDAVEDALVVPAIASLVVVFVAGQASDRLGQRRTIVASSLALVLGAVVLALAPSGAFVQLGLAICGAMTVVIQIVTLSMLQERVGSGEGRASAFTTYGMVFPLAFLILPVATAMLLAVASWRAVPLAWAAGAVATAVLARKLLGADARTSRGGEWLTPVLAGVALAAGSTILSELDNVEAEALKVIVGGIVFSVAAVGCGALMRVRPGGGFSFQSITSPALRALLIGVVIVSLVQLLTYVSISLEYLYDLTAFEAALALVPAQVGAILGAKALARVASRMWGAERAARVLMLATGATALPLVLMQAETSVWFLVAVATLTSCAGMGALTVLNMAVMGRAPAHESGAVSAFRTAASSIGTALSMAVIGALILGSVQISAGQDGAEQAELEQLAAALRLTGVLAFAFTLAGWALLEVAGRRAGDRAPAAS